MIAIYSRRFLRWNEEQSLGDMLDAAQIPVSFGVAGGAKAAFRMLNEMMSPVDAMAVFIDDTLLDEPEFGVKVGERLRDMAISPYVLLEQPALPPSFTSLGVTVSGIVNVSGGTKATLAQILEIIRSLHAPHGGEGLPQ